MSIAIPQRRILVPHFEFPAWVKRIGDPLRMFRSPMGDGVFVQPMGGVGTVTATLGLKANLVAWWELGESSGNRADSHTNGLTLTDNNTVMSAAGVGGVGTAASFVSANGESLTLADSGLIPTNTNPVTWCGWVYWDAFAGHSDLIVSKAAAIPNREFYMGYDFDGEDYGLAGKFFAGVSADGDNSTFVSTAIAISTGIWYFWVWTYTPNTISISVNGGAFATATASPPRDGNADYKLATGFSGRMAKVGVFDIALSLTQVGQLYNSGAGRAYTEL